MKLHFDPNHQYQLDAVKSIVNIFEGQPLNQEDFGFSISESGQLFNENGVDNFIKPKCYKNANYKLRKHE